MTALCRNTLFFCADRLSSRTKEEMERCAINLRHDGCQPGLFGDHSLAAMTMKLRYHFEAHGGLLHLPVPNGTGTFRDARKVIAFTRHSGSKKTANRCPVNVINYLYGLRIHERDTLEVCLSKHRASMPPPIPWRQVTKSTNPQLVGFYNVIKWLPKNESIIFYLYGVDGISANFDGWVQFAAYWHSISIYLIIQENSRIRNGLLPAQWDAIKDAWRPYQRFYIAAFDLRKIIAHHGSNSDPVYAHLLAMWDKAYRARDDYQKVASRAILRRGRNEQTDDREIPTTNEVTLRTSIQ